MKKNNKGFTLLETLIVSTFVVGTLLYLFVQINNAKTNYDITFKYDSINAIYNAKNITYFLKENGYNNLKSLLNSSSLGYIDITTASNVNGNSTYYIMLLDNVGAKTVLFTSENMTTLKQNIKTGAYSEEFKRYISKLDFDGSVQNMYRIIVEYEDNTFASVRIG